VQRGALSDAAALSRRRRRAAAASGGGSERVLLLQRCTLKNTFLVLTKIVAVFAPAAPLAFFITGCQLRVAAAAPLSKAHLYLLIVRPFPDATSIARCKAVPALPDFQEARLQDDGQSRVADEPCLLPLPHLGGRHGLLNLGNTCFLNAALQTLLHTEP